ncbi:M50 family metallopeptidase [Salsipaludibacter albus]|uniref:M50 family metallopeptidase n=1 Tax=Salsipaludibacter albus TaxID=2849650 RepID=UPI0030846803|nr:site-2 protease family protein [Salsipaludibacter albus]
MTATFGIVAFVVAIIVSIMVHEWGHFSTARRFGMRADKFFLGFGPTIWSTRRGETEYGVKALPAGGFVRVRGMARGEERRPPVGIAWADSERLAAQRRDQADATGADLLTVPLVTDAALADLDHLLDERGAPVDIRRAILDDVRSDAPSTPEAAASVVADAVDRHVPAVADDVPADAQERLSSLHHRLARGDEGRFFHDRPAWQRAIVLAAGSFWHFVIAIVLLFLGLLLLPQNTGQPSNEIASIQAGSPAEEVGLQAGDRVLSVDGRESDDFLVLRDAIREHPGEPITITADRNGEILELTGEPAAVEDPDTGETIGQFGFAPAFETRRSTLGEAFDETFLGDRSVPAQVAASIGAIGDVFGPEGIGQLFGEISGEEEREATGGISMVGGAAMTGQGVAAAGLMFLVWMIVSVNVFIGVLNLLPLPPLDGGHLAVLGVEVVTNRVRRLLGRPADFTVDPRTVAAIALPVLLVLGTVGLGLIWLDITNPIQLP